MIFLILAISHLLPSTPPYFNFFNNIIIYLRLFDYICNVENDNALRSHNFSPFFQFSIFTSTHTRYSYGHHEVFHAMTVFLMCLIHVYFPSKIPIYNNVDPLFPKKNKNTKSPFFFCEIIFLLSMICAISI